MTAKTTTFELPEIIRVEECHTLDQFIRAHSDCAIQLDGKRVRKFTGLAAQLIAAHQYMRIESKHSLCLIHPSDALINSLATLGLSLLLDSDRSTT